MTTQQSDPALAFGLVMSRHWLEKFWFDPEESEEFDEHETAWFAADSFQDHLIEQLGRSGWEEPGVTVTWKLDDAPAIRFPTFSWVTDGYSGPLEYMTPLRWEQCEAAFRKFKQEAREFLTTNREMRESEST